MGGTAGTKPRGGHVRPRRVAERGQHRGSGGRHLRQPWRACLGRGRDPHDRGDGGQPWDRDHCANKLGAGSRHRDPRQRHALDDPGLHPRGAACRGHAAGAIRTRGAADRRERLHAAGRIPRRLAERRRRGGLSRAAGHAVHPHGRAGAAAERGAGRDGAGRRRGDIQGRHRHRDDPDPLDRLGRRPRRPHQRPQRRHGRPRKRPHEARAQFRRNAAEHDRLHACRQGRDARRDRGRYPIGSGHPSEFLASRQCAEQPRRPDRDHGGDLARRPADRAGILNRGRHRHRRIHPGGWRDRGSRGRRNLSRRGSRPVHWPDIAAKGRHHPARSREHGGVHRPRHTHKRWGRLHRRDPFARGVGGG